MKSSILKRSYSDRALQNILIRLFIQCYRNLSSDKHKTLLLEESLKVSILSRVQIDTWQMVDENPIKPTKIAVFFSVCYCLWKILNVTLSQMIYGQREMNHMIIKAGTCNLWFGTLSNICLDTYKCKIKTVKSTFLRN